MCQQVNAIVSGFFCLFLAGLDLNLERHLQLQKAFHFWNVFLFRTFKRNKPLSWTIKLSETLRFVGITIIKAASTRAISTKSVVKVGSYLKIKSYPNLFIILTAILSGYLQKKDPIILLKGEKSGIWTFYQQLEQT